jgi:hypothetical protein
MQSFNPKNHRVFVWIVAAVLAAFFLIAFVFNEINFSAKIKDFEEATNNFFVQTLRSDALSPPPLRGVYGEMRDPLTIAGVFLWTNSNRKEAGKQDLTINETLTKMAKQKLDDLFAKQYFEHESPSGVGPGELAKQVGYDYIIIGENLALGAFNGDKALVDAWMASPGHRANILNSRYREIGIAIGQGVFEGKATWVAVQEFGLPITACPEPSRAIKASIDEMKKEVDLLEAELTKQKTAIDNASPKMGSDYEAKLKQYNIDVNKFNKIVISLKSKISAYNKQVAAFNECAETTSATSEQK